MKADSFEINFKELPKTYKLPNYKPTPEEHNLVNAIANLRKLFLAYILESNGIESDKWDSTDCIDKYAGLYYKEKLYKGMLTPEIIIDCFNSLNIEVNKAHANRFTSMFNEFFNNEKLEANANLISMLLTFMYHEVGGIEPRHENNGIPYGNHKYFELTGPYNLAYYGRGQIQITWEPTYKALDTYFQSVNKYSHWHPYSDPDIIVNNFDAATASTLWFLFKAKGYNMYPAMIDGDVYTATGYIAGTSVWDSNSKYANYIPARQKTYNIFLPIVKDHLIG